jgi:hypothetical protein
MTVLPLAGLFPAAGSAVRYRVARIFQRCGEATSIDLTLAKRYLPFT